MNCDIRLPRNNNIFKLSIMVQRLCVLMGVKVSDKEYSALQNYGNCLYTVEPLPCHIQYIQYIPHLIFILYVVTIAFCERLSVSCIIYSHYVTWQLSVATLYHFVYHILTVHSADWPPVWQSDSGKWWAVVRSIKDLLCSEMSCSLSLLIFNP